MSMASALNLHTNSSYYSYENPKTLISLRRPSQFISSKSISKLKNRSPFKFKKLKTHSIQVVCAAQSSFSEVIQTVWKVGRNGVEAGINLVPDSIPRPIARIFVAVVGVALAVFVPKSLLSTVFFALAVMGLSYFTYLALNKVESLKGRESTTTSTEDPLEEARRIMEKYK